MKKNRIIYPDNCFSVDHYTYKKFNEKITDLHKEFGIFLDNKKKEIKTKRNYYSISINKLFRKLVFDSTNKILKRYQKNFDNKNKRFLSAKQIQKYRDKKILLLKFIRNKNIDNKINMSSNDKNSFNNISSINNLTSTLVSLKDNNNSNDNKISVFTNRSIYSYQSLKNVINNRGKNEILKGKTKLVKELPINKNSIFKKINYKNLDNCKSNTRNKKDFDNNNDNSNLINIYDNSKDYTTLYKKINLKKLKLDIHKFEKSPKFLPNIESPNKIQPFQFVRKNYIKYNRFHFNTKVEININKKSFNNRKNSCDNINLKLNKNQNFLKLDNINIRKAMSAKRRSNNRILFKKINDIIKSIKTKKRIIKKGKTIKNNKLKKIIQYIKTKNKNKYNKFIDEEIKKDILTYQKNIGEFIFLDGKYFYTSHLPYFREGAKFI